MIIKIHLETLEDYIRTWCSILDKYYPLSEKELQLTIEYVKKTIELKAKNLTKDEIQSILYGDSYKKYLMSVLGIDNKTLNTYNTVLRKKRVLINDLISESLIPKSEIVFKLDYGDQQNN